MPIEPHVQIEFTIDAVDVPSASKLPSIACGGECIFVGRTRPETHTSHGELIALQYECYEDMARTELQLIAHEAIAVYSVQCVRITHSVGKVSTHQASVVIAVGGEHRADAFDACRFLIDNLKTRVPIWKQEQWETEMTWVEGETMEQSSS